MVAEVAVGGGVGARERSGGRSGWRVETERNCRARDGEKRNCHAVRVSWAYPGLGPSIIRPFHVFLAGLSEQNS